MVKCPNPKISNSTANNRGSGLLGLDDENRTSSTTWLQTLLGSNPATPLSPTRHGSVHWTRWDAEKPAGPGFSACFSRCRDAGGWWNVCTWSPDSHADVLLDWLLRRGEGFVPIVVSLPPNGKGAIDGIALISSVVLRLMRCHHLHHLLRAGRCLSFMAGQLVLL